MEGELAGEISLTPKATAELKADAVLATPLLTTGVFSRKEQNRLIKARGKRHMQGGVDAILVTAKARVDEDIVVLDKKLHPKPERQDGWLTEGTLQPPPRAVVHR